MSITSTKNVELSQEAKAKYRQEETRDWDGRTIPTDWPLQYNRDIIKGVLEFSDSDKEGYKFVGPVRHKPIVAGISKSRQGFEQIVVMPNRLVYSRYLNLYDSENEDTRQECKQVKPWYLKRDAEDKIIEVPGGDDPELLKNGNFILQTWFRAETFIPKQ